MQQLLPLNRSDVVGLADRYYTSPYAVSPPAEVLPFTNDKLETVRDDLVLELHRKLYQSLPQLRKMDTSGLVEMAANYRKHHRPPYGGERADPNGLLDTDDSHYDARSFQGHLYVPRSRARMHERTTTSFRAPTYAFVIIRACTHPSLLPLPPPLPRSL